MQTLFYCLQRHANTYKLSKSQEKSIAKHPQHYQNVCRSAQNYDKVLKNMQIYPTFCNSTQQYTKTKYETVFLKA